MARPTTDVAARVLGAAERLFAEHGYQGCSLLRIAKAAGTSESGVLRFFASKEDVFFAVIESALTELHARFDAALSAPDAPAPDAVAERLVLMMRVVFDLYADEPDKVALTFSEGGLSVYMLKGSQGHTLMNLPGMQRLVERVEALFALGCRRGTFVGIDPVAGREAWFGLVEGTILGWLLSSSPAGQYTAVSARKMLKVARKMIDGLALR